MKSFVLFLLAFGIALISQSCRKTLSTDNNAAGISGRWNIIVDSIPEGVGAGSKINAYHGKDGDYYDFCTDSNLYVKEAGKESVYPYHIDSDSTLTIIVSDDYSDSIPQQYKIHQSQASSLNLSTGWFYTPGNIIGRSVYLSR